MTKYIEYTNDLKRILNKVKMFVPYSEIKREYNKLEKRIIKEHNIIGNSHSLWFRCFPTDTTVNDVTDLDISRLTKENRNTLFEKIEIALEQDELAIFVS